MIPITILGLFATGLNTLIIPVYIEKKAAGREAARRFANSVFLVAALFFILLTVLVVIFAPALVKVIAYGFKGERLTLAVTLTRYLALAGIFAVLTGLLTGILQAEKQFLAPAMAGLAGNTIIVISLFFLTGSLGINSWTVGQISGAVMAFSLLFFLLSRRYGFFRAFDLRGIDWKEISRFGYLLVPLVTASGVNLINTIVNKAIASGLDSGSISAIAFASRIWGLPVSLLAIPIATALFPTFSELAASDAGRAEYSAKLTKNAGDSWFCLSPLRLSWFVPVDADRPDAVRTRGLHPGRHIAHIRRRPDVCHRSFRPYRVPCSRQCLLLVQEHRYAPAYKPGDRGPQHSPEHRAGPPFGGPGHRPGHDHRHGPELPYLLHLP